LKAIRVHEPGGVDALRYEDVPDPSPGEHEVLVAVEAAGVNFIDVYHRTGLYPLPLPIALGREGGGRVLEVGRSVSAFEPGDFVAWEGVPGSYAERVVVPAKRLIALDGLSPREGAAIMLQGLTAHYLACSTVPLQPGDVCLVHASAGGVGLLLVQIAKLRGATVIGTAGTHEKAALARNAGADHVIVYTEEDFAAVARVIATLRGSRRAVASQARSDSNERRHVARTHTETRRSHSIFRAWRRESAASREPSC
jgi:NADPH2:quinone reductase